MKFLKYIIFLSILIGLFFVIYRQSNKKGFRKLSSSFRITVLMAAILAGLIPINVEAQDFNSFKSNNQQVILAKAEGFFINPIISRGPRNFVTSPVPGRPSTSRGQPGTGANHYKFRPQPRLVDQGLGGNRPGGTTEFDNTSPSTQKNQPEKSNDFDYDYYRSKSSEEKNESNKKKFKKNKSGEQCELNENVKNSKKKLCPKYRKIPL